MNNDGHRIKHSVIVPAFNEEAGLAAVLPELFRVLDDTYEVIVIDDGSTDRTAEVSSRFPCRLIRHERNQGKVGALRTGFSHACGENIISIDADGTYPVSRIPDVARSLHDHDLVVGSRILGRNHIPWFNRVGNQIFSTAIRTLYGFPAADPLTGLWGLRRTFVRYLMPTARYAPDAEMAIKAARLRLRIFDIPVQYKPRIGTSKLPPLRAGFEHVRLILGLLRWKPDLSADPDEPGRWGTVGRVREEPDRRA